MGQLPADGESHSGSAASGVDVLDRAFAILFAFRPEDEPFIEHAIGSLEAPMSDTDLEHKFADLAEGILPAAKARKVMDLCWKVESLASAGDIVRAGVRK